MSSCDELAADACACRNVSVSYKKAYQTALLTMAPDNDDFDIFAKGLNFKRRHNNFTKERILTMNNKNLYKHKLIKLAATAFISVVLFTISTVPALAYNLPAKIKNDVMTVDPIDTINVTTLPPEFESDSLFVSTQTLESDLYSFSDSLDFSKSNWYCIDENGNVYDGTVEPRIIPCNHNFADAQVSHHTKLSGGRCSVEYYSADRCLKCGYIVVLKHIATTTFVSCPH